MPIIYDIEPEADDESAYRCWSCGALLDVFSARQRLDRRCAHCCEAEREAVSAAVHERLTSTLADIAATAGGAL
jgi:hypothetical protein